MPEQELIDHIKKTKQKGMLTKTGEIKDMMQWADDEKADKNDPIELMRKLKPV